MMICLKRMVPRRKSVFFVALWLALALPVWMIAASNASAQTTSGGPVALHHAHLHQTSSQAYVLCSGKGCNHQDPYAMKCAASMHPVADASLQGIGLVELEYSTVCQTNWTQVSSGNDVEYLAACVVREAGSDGPSDAQCYSSRHYSWINTNILWSPHNLDNACGCFVEICRGGSQWFHFGLLRRNRILLNLRAVFLWKCMRKVKNSVNYPFHHHRRSPREEVQAQRDPGLTPHLTTIKTQTIQQRIARVRWTIRLVSFFVGMLLIALIIPASPVHQALGYGGGSGFINPICGHPSHVFQQLRPGEIYSFSSDQLRHLPTPKQRPITSALGATYDPRTDQLCVASAAALDAHFGPAPSTLAPSVTSANSGGLLTGNLVSSLLGDVFTSFQHWLGASLQSLLHDVETLGFLFATPAGLTYQNTVVIHLQSWFLLVTMGALSLFLVLAGYRYMFGVSTSFRELVSAVIVAAVVAKFGPPVLGQFIDLSNAVCQGIQGAFATAGLGNLSLPFGLLNWLTAPGYLFVIYLIEVICLILLCGQMLLRLAFLCLLLAIAPVGLFLCFGGSFLLPGARQWGTLWAQAFVATLIAQPLQIICLGLGSALIASFGVSTISPVVPFVGIAALFLAWKIPDLLLSSVIRSRILSSESSNEMTQNVVNVVQTGAEMAALIAA